MLRFALRNMAVKKGKLLLVTLSIVLSATVALLAYNVSMQVQSGIVNTAGYYDIIIGPSGSATQLAMNTMFFTDAPLGTIPYSIVEDLQKNPDVNEVVPFTMGDSYNSAKLVGTTEAFLSGKTLRQGAMFSAPFEAVIGAGVADKYGLRVGDEMVTSHGLSEHGEEHEASPYTVTGILNETHTSFDNAVFTSYESIWAMHDSEGAVCAVLLRTKSFNAYYAITNAYKSDASLLVINPATVLREVLDNVDLSSRIVYVLCALILVMNIFVIWVVTLLNLYDARREIALMRLIGVGMRRITLMYALQNAVVGLAATAASLGASCLCMLCMRDYVAGMGIVLSAFTVYPLEWAIMALVVAISVLPTLLSAWRMAKKDGLEGD